MFKHLWLVHLMFCLLLGLGNCTSVGCVVHGTQETVQEGCDRYVANNIDAIYAASGAGKKEVLLYNPYIKTPIFYEPPRGYYPGPFNFERFKAYEIKGFIKEWQKEAFYVTFMEGCLRGGAE